MTRTFRWYTLLLPCAALHCSSGSEAPANPGPGSDAGGPDAPRVDLHDGGTGAQPDGSPDVAHGPQHTLSVSVFGSGTGRVSSSIGGIDCAASCSALIDEGATVTLSAVPDAGSRFIGWSGPGCAGTAPCTVGVTAALSIRARFFRPVLLSNIDRSKDIRLTPDRLGWDQVTLGAEGVRSDTAISPGSGIFYFEAQRYVDARFITIGVATKAASLEQLGVDPPNGCSIDTGGGMTCNNNFSAGFDAVASKYYGFIVDYRGAHPIIYLAAVYPNGPRIGLRTELTQVSDPLYIFVGGLRRRIGVQASINPGNDTVNFPFHYDPVAMMNAAGITGADQLVLGWGDSYAGPFNSPPSLRLGSADFSVPLNGPVTLTATASDVEDGDVTSRIQWSDLATPLGARVSGAGGTFRFVPDALGLHEVRAAVTDSGGKVTTASVKITVTGTLPVQASLAAVHLDDTDPLVGRGLGLSPDKLRVHYSIGEKMAIRANQGLLHGFQYFELHREIDPINIGGGIVTKDGQLNPYEPVDVPASCSVNVLGGTWLELTYHGNFPDGFTQTESYYGFAVDYRGTYPIVYVIARNQVIDVMPIPDATVPVYPMLYGNVTGSPAQYDESINFGATPFHNNPAAALASYTGPNDERVDLTGFQPSWGPSH